MSSESTKIEREFHEQLWQTANLSGSVERAVTEGRDLAYTVLALAEAGTGHHAVAEAWLENFGRDPRKERRRPEQYQKLDDAH